MALSKIQLEMEVDRWLRRFSEVLKPSEEYHETGVRLCEKVLATLAIAVVKASPVTVDPFTIPAAFYSGTINAHTDPCPPPLDFDIVLKVGNRQPPFADVIDLIDTTIRNNAFRLQVSPRTIKLTGYVALQFTFTNGITVKILPIVIPDDINRAEIFQQLAGSAPKSVTGNRRYYSSTLTEKPTEFIKQQSFFAHRVCRLAKFWWQAMEIDELIVVDGATMLDLLSIAAVLEEEAKGHGREAILRAFTRVVELVECLDSLALGFEREFGQYGPWKVKTITGIATPSILLPRITEPGNPKRNILYGVSPEVLEALKRNGQAMRRRLTQMMEQQEYCEIIAGAEEVDDRGQGASAKRHRVCIQIEALFGAVMASVAEEEEEIGNNNNSLDSMK